MKIRVAFMGRAYHLTHDMPDELELPESADIARAIRAVESHLSDGERLATSCLISLDGEHLGTVADYRERFLCDGDELLLIAPVAGG